MGNRRVTTSTARTAPRHFLNIGTVYWLRDHLAASGLPRTRMIGSNIRPPSNIEVKAFRLGESTPVHDAFSISLRVSGAPGSNPPVHKGALQELEIALDPFFSKLKPSAGAAAGEPLGTFVLALDPPDNALSRAAAGPHTGDNDPSRPGNCGAGDRTHDGLFRPVRLQFDLVLGADRSPQVSNLRDAQEETLPRGPHWAAAMHPDPGSTGALQRLMLDWKPDWIRQVLGKRRLANGSLTPYQEERRPTLHPRARGVEMVELHNINGARPVPNAGSAINTFLLVQKRNRSGRLVDQESGIHYVVDVDGHVTKLAHESFWVQHGGASWGPKGWGHLSGDINDGAVGIEHALFGRNPEFYPALIDASVDLVRQIVTHFGTVPPWNVVGHGHLVDGGKRGCPGVNFPWLQYENEILGEGGTPGRSVPMALCADENHFPDLKVIYNGLFESHPGTTLKRGGIRGRTAVTELQRDLRRIGFVFHRVNGTFDEGTEISVLEFHSRFMNGSHATPQNTLQKSRTVVDRDSAIQIKRVVTMLDFLQTVDFPVTP